MSLLVDKTQHFRSHLPSGHPQLACLVPLLRHTGPLRLSQLCPLPPLPGITSAPSSPGNSCSSFSPSSPLPSPESLCGSWDGWSPVLCPDLFLQSTHASQSTLMTGGWPTDLMSPGAGGLGQCLPLVCQTRRSESCSTVFISYVEYPSCIGVSGRYCHEALHTPGV